MKTSRKQLAREIKSVAKRIKVLFNISQFKRKLTIDEENEIEDLNKKHKELMQRFMSNSKSNH